MQDYISDFTWHRVYIQYTRTTDRYNTRLKTAKSIQIWTKKKNLQSNNKATKKIITMNVN